MIHRGGIIRQRIARNLFALAVVVVPAAALSQTAILSAKVSTDDAYAPLRLYGGSWDLEMAGAKGTSPTHIVNHCEKTGTFFVCEQAVNGKNEDLVIFLPTGASGETQKYRTQNLLVTAERPGDWGDLQISGDRWVYSSEDAEKGAKVYWRTTNVFSGPDKIHFEVQRSSDGKTWEMRQSGDEHRIGK